MHYIAYNIKRSVLKVYVGKKEALYNSFGINQGGGVFFERKKFSIKGLF